MENKYYLPATMGETLEKCYKPYHRAHRFPANLRLLLHKHVPIEVIANESKDDQDSSKKDKEKNPKTEWLRDIAAYYKADEPLVNAARDRWQRYVHASGAASVTMAVDWRMVVGLGGNSVFETDMTLHSLYGLPIIPGSALKGLARAWVAYEKDDKTQVLGPGGRSMMLDERIFGNKPKADFQYEGSVIFFDAILMNHNFQLTLDIMNPHYWRYYTKKDTLPSNDQKPKPIPFLTVSGARFLCAIGSADETYASDAQIALQWLEEALINYGIGSKTSAGYGYMKKEEGEKQGEK